MAPAGEAPHRCRWAEVMIISVSLDAFSRPHQTGPCSLRRWQSQPEVLLEDVGAFAPAAPVRLSRILGEPDRPSSGMARVAGRERRGQSALPATRLRNSTGRSDFVSRSAGPTLTGRPTAARLTVEVQANHAVRIDQAELVAGTQAPFRGALRTVAAGRLPSFRPRRMPGDGSRRVTPCPAPVAR